MNVKLDLVTTLLLSGIFAGVYLLISLLCKRDKKSPSFLLIFCIVSMTTILSHYFLVLSGGYTTFPHLLGVPLIILTSLGPVLYLFVKTQFVSRKVRWYEVAHFIPSIVLLYMNYPVLAAPAELKIRAIAMQWTGSILFSWYYFIFLVFLTTQMAVYLLLVNRILSMKYTVIIQESSNLLVTRIRKMRSSMRLYVVFMILFLLGYSFWSFQSDYTTAAEGLIMLAMSAFIFPTGYHYLRGEIKFEPPGERQEEPQAPEKYKNSPLTSDSTAEILAGLKTHMILEKPFLNPDLKIQDLSENIGVARHHLSQIINQELNSNFFEFINQYRVEEAKKKLLDDRYAHLTIQGIGLDCGFSNKSSFYRIFKKYTQHTPSAFIKQQKEVEMSSTF